jgi:hypothetical protein
MLQVARILIVVGAMLPFYGFFGLYRYLSYRAETDSPLSPLS